MDGVISLPIALISFVFLPDFPHHTSRRVFSEEVSRVSLALQLRDTFTDLHIFESLGDPAGQEAHGS